MRRSILIALVLASMITTAMPLAAQEEPITVEQTEQATPIEMRTSQIVDLLNSELTEPLPDIFTDEMMAAVSPAQLEALAEQYSGQFGRALEIESMSRPDGSQSRFAIRMEKAMARGTITIDPADNNRISGLFFNAFEPVNDSIEKITNDILALPGDATVYFGPVGSDTPLISIAPDKPMHLGSTIKLYIVAALAQDIAQGERRWSDVVPLTSKSFPSGILQSWPENTPMTLQSLASLMISISDNTATDQLLALLGPERVLKAMIDSGHSDPSLNDPIFSTRDLFLLKGGDKDRMALFAKGDADLRKQILAGMVDETANPADIEQAFSNGPIGLDIEWFASANDLGRLYQFMRRTADPKAFNVMAINGNLPVGAREDWAYAGYKGGSEPGVLNLTWMLTDKQGVDHLLWLSWTNPEANVEQSTLELIAQRILALPR
ncbi:MAG: serine hydrolase [Pseudomonadota bacterium]